jgi:hypothetical protein
MGVVKAGLPQRDLGVSNFRIVSGCRLDCSFQDGVHEILNGFKVEETSKIEIPVEEQHSSKEIRKDNKMKRLQNKEFGEGKGHEVQEINDNNEVVYKSRLRIKNEIREKPKIGFNVSDKVKSEFIENRSK